MNTITFVLQCTTKQPDGFIELHECEGLCIYLIYCELSSFFSRIKVRFKHHYILKHSYVYPTKLSIGPGKLTLSDGKKLSTSRISDIADILTDGNYSNLVIYIDDTAQLQYCKSLFYIIGSFSISTPPSYAETADDCIVTDYGAAGVVKQNALYKGKTVISFANNHHASFDNARYVVCLGKATHTAALNLNGVFFTPPSQLGFLPTPLRTAPYLETIMSLAGINFDNSKVRFVKNNK